MSVAALSSSKNQAFAPRRFQVSAGIALTVMLVLVGRLYFLQVMRGATYLRRSESNFLQERRVPHSRGLIYDRFHKVLVDNRPSHDVYLTMAFLPDSARSLGKLLAPLELTPAEQKALDKEILARVNQPGDDMIEVASHLSAKVCDAVQGAISHHDIRGAQVSWLGPQDKAGCALVVRARKFPSRASVLRRLRLLLGIDDEEMSRAMRKTMRKARGLGRFKPAALLEDIGFDAYARVEVAASLGELPGIDLFDSQRRRALRGSFAGHLIGFTNELKPSELKKKKALGYRLGDHAGRRGIERAWEKELRGVDGTRRVVVDAKGRDKGPAWAKTLLGDAQGKAPKAGHSLVLSIASPMQDAAEKYFMGKAGSVVAIDVKTGFLLTMASFPEYNPNTLTGRKSGKVWKALLHDPLRPLTNKAIQEHYAPGSTFKAITALAGLRNHRITETSIRMCPGYFRLGRSVWRCYNRSGHGPVALKKALQHSCDTYFYGLGHDLGPDLLAETARSYGFGSRSGLGIDREIPGIMPDRAYYVKHFGAYTPGLVVNSAIGQGDVAVTPLQLALAYATIANGGTLFQPQVVQEIRTSTGALVERFAPKVRRVLTQDAEYLPLVRRSLSHVTEKGGTAYGLQWRRDMPVMSKWIREGKVVIGGKTGTAQVVRLAKNISHIDPKDVTYLQRDHAWFVGFAPADDPEVVVVTMTEHGGFGGSTSAPVVAQVIKAYFDLVRPQLHLDDAEASNVTAP